MLAFLFCSAEDHDRKVLDNDEGLKLNITLQPLVSAYVNLLSNRMYDIKGKKDVGLETSAVNARTCFVTTIIQDKIITHHISFKVS